MIESRRAATYASLLLIASPVMNVPGLRPSAPMLLLARYGGFYDKTIVKAQINVHKIYN